MLCTPKLYFSRISSVRFVCFASLLTLRFFAFRTTELSLRYVTIIFDRGFSAGHHLSLVCLLFPYSPSQFDLCFGSFRSGRWGVLFSNLQDYRHLRGHCLRGEVQQRAVRSATTVHISSSEAFQPFTLTSSTPPPSRQDFAMSFRDSNKDLSCSS